jgi:acyl-CoA synthetase (AMP-forming)/AMP-acid ligase II
LLALGLRKGDKVALLMTNSVEMLELMLGTLKAGLVTVPFSPLISTDTLRVLLEDSESRVLFVSASLQHVVDAGSPDDHAVAPIQRIAVGFAAPGWQSYAAFLAAGTEREPAVERAPEDAAVIIYSSGTTGAPKGIVHTLRNRQDFGYAFALGLRMSDRSVILDTISLASNGAWTVVMPALLLGATLVVMPSYSASACLDVIQREQVTHVILVPAQLITILAAPELAATSLRSLECVFSVGAALREDVRAATIARISRQLYELYGLTEGAATVIHPDELATKAGTVGRPMLGCDIAILDDSDRIAAVGVPGEVIGSGMHLMQGYYRKPELTEAAIWRDAQGRNWLRTGDIGILDADGYLTIVDRKKDMLISGGLNVYPSDIEAVIGEHPDVMDVTVIGIPDEKWGETPVALVIPAPAATVTSDELRTWANARLGKHQRLAAVEFRDAFPRNALGKVLKRELRATWRPATTVSPV